jgi:hypothetical protein
VAVGGGSVHGPSAVWVEDELDDGAFLDVVAVRALADEGGGVVHPVAGFLDRERRCVAAGRYWSAEKQRADSFKGGAICG